MPSIDKYGFKFDGNTSIAAYTNPTLNKEDAKISFTAKIRQLFDDVMILGRPNASGYTNYMEISMISNKLYVTFFGETHTNIFSSISEYEINDVLNVEIIFTKNVNYFMTIIINGDSNLHQLFGISSGTFPLTQDSGYLFSAPPFYNTLSIISDFIVETDGIEVFKESFDQVTKGIVSGVEQYEIVSTEFYEGIIVNKTQTFQSFDDARSIREYVFDWFFGGEITINITGANGFTKSVGIAGYDDKDERFYNIDGASVPGQSVVFDVPNVQFRRLLLVIECDDDMDKIEVVIEKRFDTLSDETTLGMQSFTVDNVVFSGVATETRNVAFRVPDEDMETMQSLLRGDVLLDGDLWRAMDNNEGEHDTTRKVFNSQFMRVLE